MGIGGLELGLQTHCYLLNIPLISLSSLSPAGLDYVPLSVNLEFPGDDIRECVEIDLIDDTMGEPAESFIVQLTSNDLPVFRPMSTINILQDQGMLMEFCVVVEVSHLPPLP